MNRGPKDLEAATLFLRIEAGPVIVTVLLNFGLTQSNLERKSKGAWRKEVEAGHVSVALVKDSVKLNRRGAVGTEKINRCCMRGLLGSVVAQAQHPGKAKR